MMFEFAGYPGAGKTSLEQALADALSDRGHKITGRGELLEANIVRRVNLSRTRSTWQRRTSSAVYKLKLLRRARSAQPALLSFTDQIKPHLRRAAMRCIEDLQIEETIAQWSEPALFNLSEGLVQHVVSLMVWQRLLSSNAPVQPGQIFAGLQAPHRVVIRLQVPGPTALSRLNRRGKPDFWPADVPADRVIEAYEEAFHAMDQAIARLPNATVMDIDASGPPAAWRTLAHQAASNILRHWETGSPVSRQ